jgi:hypothetical protein
MWRARWHPRSIGSLTRMFDSISCRISSASAAVRRSLDLQTGFFAFVLSLSPHHKCMDGFPSLPLQWRVGIEASVLTVSILYVFTGPWAWYHHFISCREGASWYFAPRWRYAHILPMQPLLSWSCRLWRAHIVCSRHLILGWSFACWMRTKIAIQFGML